MDYARLAATAERLLRSAGRAGTIQTADTGKYNPDTSEAKPAAATSGEIVAVTLNYSLRETDGDLVRIGDVKAYAISKDIIPAVGYFVTLDGTKYRIQDPKPLNPGGITLLYELQLRRG